METKQLRFYLAFALLALTELTFTALNFETLRFLSKPLLLPILAGLYLVSVPKPIKWYKDVVLLALIFSWAGDVLLQFQGMFVAGLSSFLTAHVFYILFFVRTNSTTASFFKLRPVMLIAVLAYLIELMLILWPTLGGMKIPVLLYGITISTMLSAAFWQYKKLDDKTALFFVIGAAFFVASDSILAINKFKSPFENARIYIMTTYILAQLLIVTGAIRYRNRSNNINDI